jgi:PAS domain S-box-containing protein
MAQAPNILIVEDDVTTAMLVDIQVKSLGFTVCGLVKSGEEVLVAVQEKKPDLILMDVSLEGTMDGVETALAIMRGGVGVPVVFLTARNDHATMERIRSTMPFGCLIKPPRQEELGTAISIALRGFHLEAQARRTQDELALAFDVVSDAIIMVNSQRDIQFLNKAAILLLGSDMAYNTQENLDAVLLIQHPETTWEQWLATREKDSEKELLCVRLRSGQEKYVRAYAEKLPSHSNKSAHRVLMLVDVTGQQQAELEQRRLQDDVRRMNRALHVLSASTRVVQSATSELDLYQQICYLAVQLGYRLAWIGMAEQNELRHIKPVAQAGYNDHYLEDVQLSWRAESDDEGPTGAAIRSGEIAIARDILADDRYSDWRMEAAKRGYASGIALPLKSGDRVVGAFTIYATESDAFGTDEVDLLSELAQNMSFGLLALQAKSERQRIEQDLLKAEARYRALIEQVPVVTYVAAIDAQASRSYVSPQISSLTGYLPEQWISHPGFFLSRVHPADRQRVLSEIAQCREKNIPLASEYRLLASNGTIVWIRDEATLLRDEQGRAQFIHGVWMDISQQRSAEDSLQQAVNTLTALIEASPLAIYTQDIDGCISDVWNQAAEELFGWSRDEVLGQLPPFVTQEKLAESRAFTAKIFSGEVFTDVEVQRVNRQGITIDLNMAGAPLTDAEGRVSGAIIMLADISARKRAEVAVLASQRDATLGRMAAVVAHEVNNPLAAIKAWLGLVRSDVSSLPDACKNLDMIAAQVDRIARTVRNLLGFARQREAKDGRVPVTVLMRTVVALFTGRMRSRGIALVTDIPDQLPLVHGDNDQLQEVVINLLENASQALGPGQQVMVKALAHDGQLTIIVEDNGPGLGPDPERLFTPFMTTKVNGTGLGLSVARRICMAHGGSLCAENVDSGGARFSVRLPALPTVPE